MGKIAILLILIIGSSNMVNGEPKVPCHFIFGDSLSDAGNNNRLKTMAKANYTPYGVDFPGRIPTGRFTNGLTFTDFITQFLGLKRFITAYDSQRDEDILRGVNFASGTAGILKETASQMGDRIWMDRQLQNYANTTLKLQSMVQGSVANYLGQCLFTVNIGSNDYINNYFLPQYYQTKKFFDLDQFATLLIARFRAQLQTLYNSGARKTAVFGLGQLGCFPIVIAMNNATQCVEEVNEAVDIFNSKLVSLVDDLNAKLPGAKFTFIDYSAIQQQLQLLPLPTGNITSSICCHKLSSNFLCEPLSKPCSNRDQYAFFDGVHPTEVVNKVIATTSYDSPSSMFVHPMDIRQLVTNQLDATY